MMAGKRRTERRTAKGREGERLKEQDGNDEEGQKIKQKCKTFQLVNSDESQRTAARHQRRHHHHRHSDTTACR